MKSEFITETLSKIEQSINSGLFIDVEKSKVELEHVERAVALDKAELLVGVKYTFKSSILQLVTTELLPVPL